MIDYIKKIPLIIVVGVFFYRVKRWLSPLEIEQKDELALCLIEKSLAEKSPIDSVTSKWMELSVTTKITWIIGLGFSAGVLVGGMSIMAIYFSVAALAAVCVVHALFRLHEERRLDTASELVEETALLNQDLEAEKTTFKEVNVGMHQSASSLEACSHALVSSQKKLEEENKQLKSQVNQLKSAENKLQASVDGFVVEQSKAIDVVREIGNDAEQYRDVMKAAGNQLEEALTGVAEAVNHLQQLSLPDVTLVEEFAEAEELIADIDSFLAKQRAIDAEDDLFLEEHIALLEQSNAQFEKFKAERAKDRAGYGRFFSGHTAQNGCDSTVNPNYKF